MAKCNFQIVRQMVFIWRGKKLHFDFLNINLHFLIILIKEGFEFNCSNYLTEFYNLRRTWIKKKFKSIDKPYILWL